MGYQEPQDRVYSIVMKFPSDTSDNVVTYAFLQALELSIMGYSLSDFVLKEFSKGYLEDIIIDFKTGDFKEPFVSDMTLKRLSPVDYTHQLYYQIKDLVDWFYKEEYVKFLVIEENFNIRDIETRLFGSVVIVVLKGEMYHA